MRNILSFSANQVAKRLGDDATIWINPKNIVHDVGNIKSRKAKNIGILLEKLNIIDKNTKNCNMFYRNRFVLSDEDFTIREKIRDSDKYDLIEDFVRKIDNYKETTWFKNLSDDLSSGNIAKYKYTRFDSVEEIENFFENYLVPMGISLRDRGYDQTLTNEKCKCYVSRDGELMKGENGRHRIAFAKALKVERFPLTIFGVHEEWFSRNIGNEMDFSKIRTKYRKLEDKNQ